MKNQKNSDDSLVEIFKILLDYNAETDKLVLKSINNRIDQLKSELSFKLNQEPLKIFKKKYNKWKKEVEKLDQQLFETYKEYEKEFLNQMNFYEKLKNSN